MAVALIIVGPTGIGKSSLAEKYAEQYKIPIISADSRQIYKELNIGVAKPNQTSLAKCIYYEIDSCTIYEENNVAQYCERVANHLSHIEGNCIITGGTGFYIKALINGLEKLPIKNEKLREELTLLWKQKGIDALQLKYKQIKNPYPLKDYSNPHRLIRAIEMGEKSIVSFIPSVLAKYEICLVGLEMERTLLYERINKRVDEMIQMGLEAEARAVYEHKEIQALQTVGYQELFEYFDGKCTLLESIDKIKQHTRNYAKRQITYFKNQLNAEWFISQEIKKLDTFVQTKLL